MLPSFEARRRAPQDDGAIPRRSFSATRKSVFFTSWSITPPAHVRESVALDRFALAGPIEYKPR